MVGEEKSDKYVACSDKAELLRGEGERARERPKLIFRVPDREHSRKEEEKIEHPYPSEDQKKQLAQDTGLTILQVNNCNDSNTNNHYFYHQPVVFNFEQINQPPNRPTDRPAAEVKVLLLSLGYDGGTDGSREDPFYLLILGCSSSSSCSAFLHHHHLTKECDGKAIHMFYKLWMTV
eukprot:TCALIF_12763-PA protein Name:"Similar to hth Homeobox protein homothorax (Drosophila melanogaster)" AED:0.45 eAED:0.45 QI:0/0/0/0.25/1/1/4/0/176